MVEQKKITTTIDFNDHGYCKKHGLKFAHLIRAGVRDHRIYTDPEKVPHSQREMSRRIESLTKLAQKFATFVHDKGLEEEFSHQR